MKSWRSISACALVFALSAFAGWITSPSPGKTVDGGNQMRRSQRALQASPTDDAASAMAGLTELERKMFSASPQEGYNADGLEKWLQMDWVTCSGGDWVFYAQAWAKESPRDMFSWLVSNQSSSGDQRLQSASILFEQWAQDDPEAALAAAADIRESRARRQALISTLMILSRTDPDRARDLVVRNPDLFAGGSESLFFPAPEGGSTCKWLMSLPDGPGRTRMLVGALSRFTRLDSEEVRSLWEDVTQDLRRDLVFAGFAGWDGYEATTEKDLPGLEGLLREKAEATDDPAAAQALMDKYGELWADRDLPDALQWMQAHLKGRHRFDAGVKLMRSAIDAHFDVAFDTWEGLQDPNLKASTAGILLEKAAEERKQEVEEKVRPFLTKD